MPPFPLLTLSPQMHDTITVMPALDRYHEVVAEALRKDGWTITHNPLALTIDTRTVLVDLGAERLLGAEKGTRKIAVEIKVFGSPSPIADLENAIGQYSLYEDILIEVEPDRELFLAVPETTFQTIFSERIGQIALKKHLHRIIKFSVELVEVTEWIS
jgi:hypothetical protein